MRILGLSNLFLNMMTLYVMCDPGDVSSYVPSTANEVYIFDLIENGGGFSQKAFKLIEKIMEASFKLLMNCSCNRGCPACVIPMKKENIYDNDFDFPKEAAKYVFHVLLEKGNYEPKIVRTSTEFGITRREIKKDKKSVFEPLSDRDMRKVLKGIKKS